MNVHQKKWQDILQVNREVASQSPPLLVSGRLTKVNGLVMEAVGLRMAVGSTCVIQLPNNNVEAEVVGFSGEKLFLMPEIDVQGLLPGARVIPFESARNKAVSGQHRRSADLARHLPVGEMLLGRVLDGAGRPLDQHGPLPEGPSAALQSRPINPLDRAPIKEVLDVGVRAINALLTVGRGQRMGLFAGSGVGKSVLLGMMARYTTADVIVVGLIGERGREVKEFITDILGTEGLKRAVVVAAPADTSPLLRLQGAAYATTIAEYFRDQGKNVLLIMDSLTRYAMAQREIGLAIGEPPTTRGYTPSVFALLPRLLERSGAGEVGAITALYTVLVEGDDMNEPVTDAVRGILDGHIVLSRSLANFNHYPAIDVLESVSRLNRDICTAEENELAARAREHLALYRKNEDLVSIGAYQKGSSPALDQAISLQEPLRRFLRQDMHELTPRGECFARLRQILT